MIMNTRDKEMTDQPRLNHFDLKSNSTCNMIFVQSWPSGKRIVFQRLNNIDLLIYLSLSPSYKNRPIQGKRKTLTRVGIEPTTFAFDRSLWLSFCGPTTQIDI